MSSWAASNKKNIEKKVLFTTHCGPQTDICSISYILFLNKNNINFLHNVKPLLWEMSQKFHRWVFFKKKKISNVWNGKWKLLFFFFFSQPSDKILSLWGDFKYFCRLRRILLKSNLHKIFISYSRSFFLLSMIYGLLVEWGINCNL